MRGCLGWLFLMPIVGAFGLAVITASACGKKGGMWRLLGISSSLAIGGLVIGFTYLLFSGEGGSTVLWWISMVAGGIVILLGIWTAIMTEEEGQRTELEELARKQLNGGKLGKLDEEKWEAMWKSAKEEGKRILEQDKIDNYERFILIQLTLSYHANDDESYELYQQLDKLQRKWFIEEAREILKQSNIGDYKKKEWQRLNWICYRLSHYHDPEATELLEQLEELKWRASRNRS